MRILNAWVTALAGIAVTVGLAHFGIPWATVAIGTGATITAVLLFVRRGGRKYYALAGTVFCLGIALAFGILDGYADTYHQDVVAVGLGLGIVSGIIVSLQWTGERIVKWVMAGKAGEEGATAIYNAIAAIIGLISMVWTVLTAYEKAGRYGGVGLTGASGLALNLIGARIPIPIWFIDGGVDASIVLFVGAVLIGFHSLESIHTTWHAMKVTGKGAASAGKTGAGMVSGRIRSNEDRSASDIEEATATSREASQADIESAIEEASEPRRGTDSSPSASLNGLDYSVWILAITGVASISSFLILPSQKYGDFSPRLLFVMVVLFGVFFGGLVGEIIRFVKATAFGLETTFRSKSNFIVCFVPALLFILLWASASGITAGVVTIGAPLGILFLVWSGMLTLGGFG